MSFRRVSIFTCDICNKDAVVKSDEHFPKGWFYFPSAEPDGMIETKHRCPDCPEQPNERPMGTR